MIVAKAIYEKLFDGFAKNYAGTFTNQHGHTIQCDVVRAFEILYSQGGEDAIKGLSINKPIPTVDRKDAGKSEKKFADSGNGSGN